MEKQTTGLNFILIFKWLDFSTPRSGAYCIKAVFSLHCIISTQSHAFTVDSSFSILRLLLCHCSLNDYTSNVDPPDRGGVTGGGRCRLWT